MNVCMGLLLADSWMSQTHISSLWYTEVEDCTNTQREILMFEKRNGWWMGLDVVCVFLKLANFLGPLFPIAFFGPNFTWGQIVSKVSIEVAIFDDLYTKALWFLKMFICENVQEYSGLTFSIFQCNSESELIMSNHVWDSRHRVLTDESAPSGNLWHLITWSDQLSRHLQVTRGHKCTLAS